MYKCYYCQFAWSDRYTLGDKTRRTELEAVGQICPRCRVPQYEVAEEDTWMVKVRKFLYGKSMRRDDMLRFEEFLCDNFTPRESKIDNE